MSGQAGGQTASKASSWFGPAPARAINAFDDDDDTTDVTIPYVTATSQRRRIRVGAPRFELAADPAAATRILGSSIHSLGID